MRVLVPDQPEARALGRALDGVELEIFRPGLGRRELEGVEFCVPPWWQPRELAEALPRMRALRVVQSLSAGVDWLAPLVPPPVTLCNAKGIHDAPVAEWVLAAILAMEKRLPQCLEDQRRGRWSEEIGDDIAGKRVVILGYGSIGRAVEARLAPLGVIVERVARSAREGVHDAGDLPALLPRADILASLLPLTDETRGILDRRLLGAMRPGALLVNAGRGGTVDQVALEEALRAGTLRAALDVTDPEPLPEGHSLLSAPNCLITPHMAGRTPSFAARSYRFARRQLERYLDDRPLLNVVRAGAAARPSR